MGNTSHCRGEMRSSTDNCSSRYRPRPLHRLRRAAVLALGGTLALTALFGSSPQAPAQAAEYSVTSGADSGPGTLRAAIAAIDPADSDPVVTIAPGLTIMLEQHIEIPDVLTVRGDPQDYPVITFDPEGDNPPDTLFDHDGASIDFNGEYIVVQGFPEDDERNGALWNGIVSAESATEASVTLREISVEGAVKVVNVESAPSASVRILDSAFEGIGRYRDGEGSMVELSRGFDGSLTVQDSTFDKVWVHLTWAYLRGGTIAVERSTFKSPNLGSLENPASVLTVEYQGGATPGTVPVTIRDSTFSGVGGDDAGAFYFESWDSPVGTPVAAEITGSTFSETAASDDYPNGFTMQLDDPDTSVVVRNSTFLLPPGTEAHGWNEGLVLQQEQNTARLVLDHVTSNGLGVSAKEAAVVTIQDSAFLTPETGVIMHPDDRDTITGNTELAELDVSQVAIERSAISVPGPRFPSVAATPAGDFALGDLSANGGPTLTMLPGPGSALIGAAGGEATQDQRGFSRPAGGAPDLGAVEVQPSALALVADVTVAEGQPLEFVVTREGGELSHPAGAEYATRDGSAIAPKNYAATTGAVVWAAGDWEPKRIIVASQQDGLVTDPLSFSLELSSTAAHTVIADGASSRTGTLTNIDEAPVTPPGPKPDPDPGPDPKPAAPRPDTDGKLADSGASVSGTFWGFVALALGAALITAGRTLRRRRGA